MTGTQVSQTRRSEFRSRVAGLPAVAAALLPFCLSAVLNSASAQTQAVPPPGSTLVATQTVSAGTAIQFTGLAGNAPYRLTCHGVQVGTNNVHVELQVGEGSAPSWETASSYWVAAAANNSSGSAVASFDSQAAGGIWLDWSTGIMSNAGTALALFDILFADLAAAGYKKFNFTGALDNGSGNSNSTFGYGAWHGDTGAVTAVQLVPSSGTISGTCNLYQLAGA